MNDRENQNAKSEDRGQESLDNWEHDLTCVLGPKTPSTAAGPAGPRGPPTTTPPDFGPDITSPVSNR